MAAQPSWYGDVFYGEVVFVFFCSFVGLVYYIWPWPRNQFSPAQLATPKAAIIPIHQYQSKPNSCQPFSVALSIPKSATAVFDPEFFKNTFARLVLLFVPNGAVRLIGLTCSSGAVSRGATSDTPFAVGALGEVPVLVWLFDACVGAADVGVELDDDEGGVGCSCEDCCLVSGLVKGSTSVFTGCVTCCNVSLSDSA